ncbi:uncharacterized protein Z518_06324 [Rhinocladiella mackenziei CBS 650.93]|uniref:NB-ARC domain-containing protein n=1 Tax=Rhinocladiella mackenziei CBS 650.93 TaxID=1442369 RepID=A0A0D2FTP1_9EURO|nr:uncharacterized protein Z518_06324 [Rhinocladiella mackenziei CBS 650.93]KIX05452.1 hypothetical protein Z518_06324 [Rhinocladiella mackenziei CBS 650.93]
MMRPHSFRRSKAHLDEGGRYYRFNVARGLEEIGLEDSKTRKEIAAATQEVFKQMTACANRVSVKQVSQKYNIPFSLRGVPVIDKFADRPTDLADLGKALFPRRGSRRRQIFVLSGLGGMGQSQLAAQFARRNHSKYSAVLWLDGSSEENLKQSIAYAATRIPAEHVPETVRTKNEPAANLLLCWAFLDTRNLCFRWVVNDWVEILELEGHAEEDRSGYDDNSTDILNGFVRLGNFYTDQAKLRKAEEMYKRALRGYEQALEMYERALRGYEKALGKEHTSILSVVHNLGALYADQGKLDQAEEMCERSLHGYEKALHYLWSWFALSQAGQNRRGQKYAPAHSVRPRKDSGRKSS